MNGSPISRQFERGGVVVERIEGVQTVADRHRAAGSSVKRRVPLWLFGVWNFRAQAICSFPPMAEKAYHDFRGYDVGRRP